MANADVPELGGIAPFFIVRDVTASVRFYRDYLGFEVVFSMPDEDAFFAILGRGGARLMVKVILPEIQAVPNRTRHPWAKWDANVHAPDPDALAAELTARGANFIAPLMDTEDGLRGFEVQDPDGYVIFLAALVEGRSSVFAAHQLLQERVAVDVADQG